MRLWSTVAAQLRGEQASCIHHTHKGTLCLRGQVNHLPQLRKGCEIFPSLHTRQVSNG
ncbi:MAG: hypothetical protein BJ554DRAFT_8374 [Olpidium bornovanus]|uniref:Uncharacterized protein n=1 Tax=Olpidium bornovanus TaxID=278681 RepID=A0A8H7ZUQ4_9FUNG|nr:MAG: hypothetical protein BJ554DRAFT_8374 [Olpidium bornovanus]